MKAAIIITTTTTIGNGTEPIINRSLRASIGMSTSMFANPSINN